MDISLKTDLAVANLPLQTYPHSLDHDPNYRRQNPPNVYTDHGFSAASKNQIRLYNDDVRLKYDTVIERHLLNSPNPADKAKYYQFLKAKEDEKLERQVVSLKEQQQRRRPPAVSIKIRPIQQTQATHVHFKIKPLVSPIPSTPLRFHSKSPSLQIDRSTQYSYKYPFL